MLQLEYYFSRENLARDTFLVNQMNAEAFAPVALVAGFAKMKAYTTDMSLILEAIKESSKLELDEAETHLRPVDVEMGGGTPKSVIVLRDIPTDVTEEQIRELFDEETFGPIDNLKSEIGQMWFVEFVNDLESDVMDKLRLKQLNGQQIKAKFKKEANPRTMISGGERLACGVAETV